jgi:acetyl esterase/lipase
MPRPVEKGGAFFDSEPEFILSPMGIRNPYLLICLLLLAAPVACAYDIPGFTPDQIIPFKQTLNSTGGAVTLNLHVFTPPGHKPSHQRPAIVFFFGGGWADGSASHFHPQCEYLASRGMVAISAEYRVQDLHGTTPQECVKDGKSAIRYVRQNAVALGGDPNRIAAGGGSAGGYVAAATGTLSTYDEATENLTISSKPNALVLYNPVVDNGPGGYGHNTVQAYWQSISPLNNITGTAPPTSFFLGTSDSLVPVSVGENYRAAMEAMSLRCDLHLYQGQPHSFFNYDVPVRWQRFLVRSSPAK